MVLNDQGKLLDGWVEDFVAENDDVNSISVVAKDDADLLTSLMAGVGLPDMFCAAGRDSVSFQKAIDLLDLTPLYEEDQDILEDVLIEIHQAIEMCNIYSNILSGTMDAFASVISNNLNIVMKILTVITIVMAIPNIIFSFYGMNVSGLPYPEWWFPTAVAAICCIIATLIFKKKDMFH